MCIRDRSDPARAPERRSKAGRGAAAPGGSACRDSRSAGEAVARISGGKFLAELPRTGTARRVPVSGCRCEKNSRVIAAAGYQNAALDLIFAWQPRNVPVRICTDADLESRAHG